ncbi:hypothetical protein [Halohasta litorea]|uniref:DUF7847 domain-containing protein n=1 Tax=Halohasta litorea TaxID=869891 RepID=A0ABD6DES7_9EURY|nr:hypothetical protein [Halohasta litorea]
MSFRLGSVVTDGLRLTFSRNGAVFVVLTCVAQLLSLLLVGAAVTRHIPVAVGGIEPVEGVPLAGSLPAVATAVAVGLTTLFSAVVTMPITIIMIRTFVDGVTDRIPADHLFGHLGRATTRGIAVSLVSGLAIVAAIIGPLAAEIGFIIVVHDLLGSGWLGIAVIVGSGLVALGVTIAATVVVWLHLLFVLHEVSVRGRTVVGALRGSWAVVRGHRVRVGVLGVLLVGLQQTVSSIATPSRPFDPTAEVTASALPQLLALPIGVAAAACMSVLSAAILAQAYAELVDASDGRNTGSGDATGGTAAREATETADRSTGTDAEPAP